MARVELSRSGIGALIHGGGEAVGKGSGICVIARDIEIPLHTGYQFPRFQQRRFEQEGSI